MYSSRFVKKARDLENDRGYRVPILRLAAPLNAADLL
jgi:hypothetical protein